MGGGSRDGHYVALRLKTKKNGNVICSVANSLEQYNCDTEIKDLITLLSARDFQHVVRDEDSDAVRECLIQLELINYIHKGEYTYATIDKNPQKLLSELLVKAEKLANITHGQAMWTDSGFRDIRWIINDVYEKARQINGKEIKFKARDGWVYNSRVFLTIEELEKMKAIEKALEDEHAEY